MKKALLLIIAVCTICGLKAQNNNTTPQVPKTYRLGILLSSGVSWASSTDPTLSSSSVRIPFAYGLVLDYSFARNYALSFGLNDLRTGGTLLFKDSVKFKSFPDIFSSGAKTTYHIEYIEVPVILKLKSNKINYVTYFAQVGVTPKIKIAADGDIQASNRDISNEPMSKDAALFGIGLVIGGGIEYQLTENNSLIFSLAYDNSFTSFKANETGNSFYNNATGKLRRIALSAGVFF